MHPNRASGTVGQIKCNPARKWAAVINHHGNRFPVLGIHHRYLRSERQRAMSGRISTGIECLTHSPFVALRHRGSRPRAAPNKFREVWSVRRTKRSPDCEPARTTSSATPEPIQTRKKIDAPTHPLHPTTFPKGTDLIVAMANRAPTWMPASGSRANVRNGGHFRKSALATARSALPS
jgi:hypothetical protein